VNYRGQRMMIPVTRELFEDLTKDLLQQCEDTAEIVLEKANMRWSELDNCLLVGGSTRMPMVQNLLHRLAGTPPSNEVNPEQCVALGAALAGVFRHRPEQAPAIETIVVPKMSTDEVPQSGALIQLEISAPPDSTGTPVPGKNREEVVIEDATTHPLGIVVLDGDRKERVVELIPEGTKLPHEYIGRFAYAYENMRAVRVEVTEGVGAERDEVSVIGKVELTGLPPRPRGTPIEVIYRYSANQILSVHVIDVETGKSRAADIRFSGGLTDGNLVSARERNQGIAVE
jgi:molecular chaperone DnaK